MAKTSLSLDSAIKVLFELTEAAVDVSASGNTAALDTEFAKNVSWIADLTALTGTAPTIDFTWQHSPDNATWFDVAAEAQLTAAGIKQRFTRESLMRYVRIKWVSGGTITTGTASFYIQAL